jgi:hypothetical protein
MSYLIENASYTNQALTVFLNLLRGGLAAGEYSPTFIDIGIGGNYWAGVDTHVRVGPDPSETEIRLRVFRARVVGTEIVSNNEVKYTAMIEPHDCIRNDINEMSLITSNGIMLSHWVAPEAGPTPSPCEVIDKSGYVTFFIEWKIRLTVSV